MLDIFPFPSFCSSMHYATLHVLYVQRSLGAMLHNVNFNVFRFFEFLALEALQKRCWKVCPPSPPHITCTVLAPHCPKRDGQF
jgi:hypothetical protein